MMLAVKGWAKRGTDRIEIGDRFGAFVANTDLVKAALHFNVVNGVHVLVDDFTSPGIHLLETTNHSGIASDLRQEFGADRVRLTSFSEADLCFQERQCVFLGGGPELTLLAAARPHLASVIFPICTILHAVKWDTLFSNYAYATILCQPCDALVATSTAGRGAVDLVLRDARKLMGKSESRNGADENYPRLVNIPLGVDERTFFPRDPKWARQRVGIPSDRLVILFLGRLTDHFKADLEPLLIATSKLAQEIPEVLLVVSGEDVQDVYASQLSEIGSLLGMGSNLKVMSNVPPNLKPLLYSTANVFVSPVDNIQETFGLSLLEAMSSGLPVVASDWSGYRDIVRDSIDGFLVPTYWNPRSAEIAGRFATVMSGGNEYYLAQRTIVDTKTLYDRLRLLAVTPELRQQFGAAGRARVETHFAWRSVAEKFGELWSQQLADINVPVNSSARTIQPRFDYNAIFHRYATETLCDSYLMTVDNQIPHYAQLLRARLSHMSNKSLVTAIETVYEQCSSEPRPVSQILMNRDRAICDALFWLLKKGFCHISVASPKPV